MPARRWLWIGLIVVPVLLAGAHYTYWRIASEQLEHGLASWLAQRQMAGWTTDIGVPVRGGYPFAASLAIPAVALHSDGREIPGGLTWKAERVVLRVRLTQPRLLQVNAEGAQQLRMGDAPLVPFRADRLRLVVPLDPGFPRWSDIVVSQLRAGMPAGDAAAGLTVGAFRAHGDLRPAAPQGEAAVTFTLHADAIRLPNNVTWPLGPDVARIDLDGTVGGPLPRAGSAAQAASQWRDGGGTVEIAALRLNWGKLAVDSSATLALDEQLQPMGTGTARIKGQSEALDALVMSGAMTPGVAQMARTMIALFAPPKGLPGNGASASGGNSAADAEVEIPLTLQNRRLFTRQLPLARLPVLRWPGR